MIRGYVEGGLAWVDLRVNVPALSRQWMPIPFLVDTGSTQSVIVPEDALVLGVDAGSLFPDPRSRVMPGFGGSLRFITTMAELRSDVRGEEQPNSYQVALGIVEPGPGVRNRPSVLGMDFLRHFRVTISVAEDRVELERIQ